MLESETYLEKDGWIIDKLIRKSTHKNLSKTDDSWWVLRKSVGTNDDEHISIPFDSITASGSLIKFKKKDKTTAVLNGALDGTNQYKESEIPEEVVDKLKEIGPW